MDEAIADRSTEANGVDQRVFEFPLLQRACQSKLDSEPSFVEDQLKRRPP